MKIIKKVSVKIAANTMILLSLCSIIFHFLIVFRIIPYNIVWGGRIETLSQMYVFEMISLTINLFILVIIGIKAGHIKPYLHEKVVTFVLWGLVVLFLLNTIGNILSLNSFEAVVFTPVTMIAAIFCCRLAVEK